LAKLEHKVCPNVVLTLLIKFPNHLRPCIEITTRVIDVYEYGLLESIVSLSGISLVEYIEISYFIWNGWQCRRCSIVSTWKFL